MFKESASETSGEAKKVAGKFFEPDKEGGKHFLLERSLSGYVGTEMIHAAC